MFDGFRGVKNSPKDEGVSKCLLSAFCVSLNQSNRSIHSSATFPDFMVISAFFVLYQKKAIQKYEKCFLFQLKSYFRSQDIQFFVMLPNLFHSKWKLKN